MNHNLDKYIPEFDEHGLRVRLAEFDIHQLTDMLVDAYKEKGVFAKMLDVEAERLRNIEAIIKAPSSLTKCRAYLLQTISGE